MIIWLFKKFLPEIVLGKYTNVCDEKSCHRVFWKKGINITQKEVSETEINAKAYDKE